MRRVDLAERLLLTPSGVTRLLDGLETAGFVRNETCASDGRVTYAVLTDEGGARLAAASCSHVAAIEALFDERYSTEEVARLAELLGRLPGADGSPSCRAPR
jgi:DNA-binding MarR family transcriptional regulator